MRAYDFEIYQKDRLNEKLHHFISLVGTIATLNLGVGFFILDKISMGNPFFLHLIASLISGVGLFAAAIFTALTTLYKPTKYYVFLSDPKGFIKKYAKLTKTHVVRESTMTMADVVELNREVNLQKVKMLDLIVLFVIFGTVALVFFTVFTAFALAIPPPIDP